LNPPNRRQPAPPLPGALAVTGTDPRAASDPLAIAVMVSGAGRGSNLAALIDGSRTDGASYRTAVVVGTRADAPAVERARAAGVAVAIISPRK